MSFSGWHAWIPKNCQLLRTVGRRPRTRLHVEELEDRQLLSVAVQTFSSPAISPNTSLRGITAGPDGNLWFSQTGNSPTDSPRIVTLNPTTHAVTEAGRFTDGLAPQWLTTGRDGNIWFSEDLYSPDVTAGAIGVINPTTHAVSEFSLPTRDTDQVHVANGIAAGPDGNIWFTEGLIGVGMINPTTHVISEFSPPLIDGIKPEPTGGITAGADGNVWFLGIFPEVIDMINPTTHAISQFQLPGLFPTQGITAGPDGNLWFPASTPQGSSVIAEFSPTTHALTVFNLPANIVQSPLAITAGADGNIWFPVLSPGELGMINPTTHALAFFANPASPITSGEAITSGPDGNLWFTNFGDPRPIGEGVLPVAHNFSVTLTAASLTIPVLAHVTDPGDTLTLTGVTPGQKGTASVNPDGTVTYTLTGAVSGTDTFTYTVVDSHGWTGTATVTVTINVPPATGINVLLSQIPQLNLGGQENSLTSILQTAQAALARGNGQAASGQLGAFANKIKALVQSGKLTAAQGDILVGEEQVLLGQL